MGGDGSREPCSGRGCRTSPSSTQIYNMHSWPRVPGRRLPPESRLHGQGVCPVATPSSSRTSHPACTAQTLAERKFHPMDSVLQPIAPCPNNTPPTLLVDIASASKQTTHLQRWKWRQLPASCSAAALEEPCFRQASISMHTFPPTEAAGEKNGAAFNHCAGANASVDQSAQLVPVPSCDLTESRIGALLGANGSNHQARSGSNRSSNLRNFKFPSSGIDFPTTGRAKCLPIGLPQNLKDLKDF